MAYTLTLTNTGSVTQSYALGAEAIWEVNLSVTEVVLAPGNSAAILSHVHIPVAATGGDMDSATIVAASNIGPSASASTVLSTHVAYRVFLPILLTSIPPSP